MHPKNPSDLTKTPSSSKSNSVSLSRPQWQGIYPALTTKMTADGHIDYQQMETTLLRMMATGMDGMILCGSLGEASSLDTQEKLDLLKHALRTCGKKVPVILTVAESSTLQAQRLVEAASAAGADGFMVLPPLRYKALDHEILEYFHQVARSTSLPLMIYNNPVDYPNGVDIPLFEKLAEIPHVEAIKDSTRGLFFLSQMHIKFGQRFKILCGLDTLALESRLMGASGWVTGLGLAFPQEARHLWDWSAPQGPENIHSDSHHSGPGSSLVQWREKALRLYHWFLPLLELDVSPQLVQNIKLAEHFVFGDSPAVRAPRLPLSAQREAEVRNLVLSKIKHKAEWER